MKILTEEENTSILNNEEEKCNVMMKGKGRKCERKKKKKKLKRWKYEGY